jgi:hypothetical protein
MVATEKDVEGGDSSRFKIVFGNITLMRGEPLKILSSGRELNQDPTDKKQEPSPFVPMFG